jgi:hypothetical protein
MSVFQAPPKSQGAILAQSGVQASLTGTLTETALATITIPANAMGANGSVRITTLWSNNNSGNIKTQRVRFSSISGTAILAANQTTNVYSKDVREFHNRNATNSQVYSSATGTGGWGAGAGAVATMSEDTTAATTIVISGQLANTGDNMALEHYRVELFPG